MHDHERDLRARRREAIERRETAFAVIAVALVVSVLYVGLGYALDHPVNAQRQEMRIQK